MHGIGVPLGWLDVIEAHILSRLSLENRRKRDIARRHDECKLTVLLRHCDQLAALVGNRDCFERIAFLWHSFNHHCAAFGCVFRRD